MKKRFEITEAGKARVASPEFAEEIRLFIRQKRADESCTKEMGVALIVFRIATALAGLENPNPFSTS